MTPFSRHVINLNVPNLGNDPSTTKENSKRAIDKEHNDLKLNDEPDPAVNIDSIHGSQATIKKDEISEYNKNPNSQKIIEKFHEASDIDEEEEESIESIGSQDESEKERSNIYVSKELRNKSLIDEQFDGRRHSMVTDIQSPDIILKDNQSPDLKQDKMTMDCNSTIGETVKKDSFAKKIQASELGSYKEKSEGINSKINSDIRASDMVANNYKRLNTEKVVCKNP